MSKKKGTLVDLLPTEIRIDGDWNCRQEKAPEGGAESPDQAIGQLELDASVLEHGVFEPPCVMWIEEQWWLVFGFRRIDSARRVAPEKPVGCVVLESTGDVVLDRENARVANLVENLHRKNLRAWEIADALYQLKLEHGTTAKAIAKKASLSDSYVRNLIRLRANAHPKVWQQFKKWGSSLRINYQDVLTISAMPKARQLDAWNELVESQKKRRDHRGRPKGSRERRPGPAKLLRYYDAVRSGKTARRGDFRKGLELGLAIALGKKKWTIKLVDETTTDNNPKEQEK